MASHSPDTPAARKPVPAGTSWQYEGRWSASTGLPGCQSQTWAVESQWRVSVESAKDRHWRRVSGGGSVEESQWRRVSEESVVSHWRKVRRGGAEKEGQWRRVSGGGSVEEGQWRVSGYSLEESQ